MGNSNDFQAVAVQKNPWLLKELAAGKQIICEEELLQA
jgi:hypothetical protein